MWKKIKEVLCKHSVHKDESTSTTATTAKITTTKTTLPSTISGSLIDLKPSGLIDARRKGTADQRISRRTNNKSNLNKTDEHSRSLFNLLPTSIRPRYQQHQTSNSKAIDASTITTTSTATQASPENDPFTTDYDSGYMSQSVLNRTASYVSCYSAVATTTAIPSMNRYGSIESLLNGHSKSNPAKLPVVVRKDFEPFAQAHLAVRQGSIVTALFSRGPWLYVRNESNGLSGYIPRIICIVYKNRPIVNDKNYHQQHQLSFSSSDSSSNKDDELDLTTVSNKNEKHFIRPYQKHQHQSQQAQINRYLSHSSAMINENEKPCEQIKRRFMRINPIDRDRRNTCTILTPASNNTTKDRRLTLNAVNWPLNMNKIDQAGIHQVSDGSITANGLIPSRDTDSSSTQDSGYSDSTPYFLVQQISPDTEQTPTVIGESKAKQSPSEYANVRRSALLKVPDAMNAHHYSLRRPQGQNKGSNRSHQHRHTLLNGISMNDMMIDDNNKRHSFGNFYGSQQDTFEALQSNANLSAKAPTTKSSSIRPVEFALIRNVRRESDVLYQRFQPALHNFPKSHRQIPASIILHHHRQNQEQKQQFGSSHSAFRPVQPSIKGKRASSEGHSPSNEEHPIGSRSVSTSASSLSSSSCSSSSSSSSISSLSNMKSNHSNKQRRSSCDLPLPNMSKVCLNSLTRSVYDPVPNSKLNQVSRTMSEILCDQFSEINLDAIEKDSLQQTTITSSMKTMKALDQDKSRKLFHATDESFTIVKDYRSSRASFSVKRGDSVNILKPAGRACFLVRKQSTGQIGFLPKGILIPNTKTRVETFLEMHGYQETVI